MARRLALLAVLLPMFGCGDDIDPSLQRWERVWSEQNSGVWWRSYGFAPSGERFACLSEQGVEIRDTRTGEVITIFPHLHEKPYTDGRHGVPWSPDGTRILTYGDDPRTVTIRDAKSGNALASAEVSRRVIRPVWSPDAKEIMAVDASMDGPRVLILGGERLEEREELVGHSEKISDAAYIRGGSHIVTTSWDSRVRVWDAKTRNVVAVLKEHGCRVFGVTVSYDGSMFVTGGNARWGSSNLIVWDAETLKPIHGFRTDDVVTGTPSVDGRLLQTVSGWDFYVYDLKRERLIKKVPRQEWHPFILPRYSPDGKYAITMKNEQQDNQELIMWRRRGLDPVGQDVAKDSESTKR